MSIGQKTELQCLRLELNERLKYIEKNFNNFIKKSKLLEIYNDDILASYQIVFNDNLKYTIRIKQDKTFEVIGEGVIINYINFKKFNLASNNGFIVEYDDLCKIINGGLTNKTVDNIENILANGIQNNQNNQLDLFYTPGTNRKMKIYLAEKDIKGYKKEVKKRLEKIRREDFEWENKKFISILDYYLDKTEELKFIRKRMD